MVMDAVVQRCVEQSPVTVMARLAMQRALEPDWIDELFEQERGLQYTRQLLFSTTVELMSVVAVGLRPSLHAAAKACKDLPVSLQALYDKINGTSPGLVQGSATRLGEVLAPMLSGKAPMVPGYTLRIVDGNHLPASEKRLKPLRGFLGAALPGQSLVVYDPDTDLIVQRLEAVPHSEVQTLGHPRTALFAFGVAVMAYNVLAVLQSAVWAAHDLQHDDIELSSYCFADEIRAHYAGMVMAVIPTAWEP